MNPHKLYTKSLAFFALLWLIAPLEVVIDFSPEALIIFFALCASLYYGVKIKGTRLKLALPEDRVSSGSMRVPEKTRTLFHILLALAIFGLCLRAIDKILIRDIISFATAVERRDSDTEASILGVLSAPLYSLLLLLPVFAKPLNFGLIKTTAIFALGLVPAIEVLYLGSRGLAITTFIMFLLYVWFNYRLSLTKKLGAVIALWILGSIFLEIFLARVDSYGFSATYSAFNSGYAFTLVPNEWLARLAEAGEWDSQIFIAVMNFSQYYLHGVLEFFYLYDNFDLGSLQYGAYTFSLLGKLFGYTVDSYLTPRFGVYTTLFGPLWVDFGYLTFFIVFLIGYYTSYCFKLAIKGDILYIPLCGYFAAVVLFAPVVNLIQSALGMYVLSACYISLIVRGAISQLMAPPLKG